MNHDHDDNLPITHWIEGIKRDDPRAAELIWQQYFESLVKLARNRLCSLPRAAADEEDLALSALNSLLVGARDNRFPKLADRTDLWKLLIVITGRKAIGRHRKHHAAKRPDRMVLANGPEEATFVSESMGREPSPEFAALFADEVHRLLAQLPGEEFRNLAILKMEGYTNREIAARLDCYEVKIERRLRIIRKQWSSTQGDDP